MLAQQCVDTHSGNRGVCTRTHNDFLNGEHRILEITPHPKGQMTSHHSVLLHYSKLWQLALEK